MEQKSLTKNAVLNILRTSMNLVFPLITFPYTSRILEPDGAGKLSFASSIISYFSIIAVLGISNYGIRECAKVRDDKEKLSKLSKELLTINLISTIVAYICFFISLFIVQKFADYKLLLCINSVALILNTLSMEWLYCALEDYGFITMRSFLFQSIGTICLFIFIKTKDDYIKCAILNLFSSTGSCLLNFYHARKFISLRSVKKLELKQHLKPIFVLFAMSVTVSIYTLLDTSMVGFLSGDFDVGIYTAATKINKLVLALVASIGTVLLPRLSYYSGINDKEKFNSLVYININIVLLFGFPSAIGLSVLAKPIVLLFSGNMYYPAILVSQVMNPIIIIIGLSNIIGVQLFMPISKEKYTLYSVLIGAVTNFTLNYILIPKYGALGAGIATVCAESFVTIAQLLFARKVFSFMPILKNFFIYFIDALIMGICVYLIVFKINSYILQLVIGIPCGVIVYFVLLLLEKNRFMLEVLQKIGTRFGKK